MFEPDGFLSAAENRHMIRFPSHRPAIRAPRSEPVNPEPSRHLAVDELSSGRGRALREALAQLRPPAPVAQAPAPTAYTVQPGDSYYRVAQNHATALLAARGLSPSDPSYSGEWHRLSFQLVQELKASNGNRPLRPGDQLLLPPDASGAAPAPTSPAPAPVVPGEPPVPGPSPVEPVAPVAPVAPVGAPSAAAEQALAWSADQLPGGSGTGVNSNNGLSVARDPKAWNSWCLAFVSTAYGRAVPELASADAKGSMAKFDAAGKLVRDRTNIPPGAPVFFEAGPRNGGFGHIAIFTGRYDANGEPIIRTSGWNGYDGIHEVPLSWLEAQTGSFVGWGQI